MCIRKGDRIVLAIRLAQSKSRKDIHDRIQSDVLGRPMVDAVDAIVIREVMIYTQGSFILPASAWNGRCVVRSNGARRWIDRSRRAHFWEVERDQLRRHRIEEPVGNPDELLTQTSYRVVCNLVRCQ